MKSNKTKIKFRSNKKTKKQQCGGLGRWLFRSAAQREAKAPAAENTRRAAEEKKREDEEKQKAARAKARAEARAEAEFQEKKSNAAKAEKNLKDWNTVDRQDYRWEYRRYPLKIYPVEKDEWTEIVENEDVIKAVNAIEDAANINILMNTIFKIFGLEEDSRALASAVRYSEWVYHWGGAGDGFAGDEDGFDWREFSTSVSKWGELPSEVSVSGTNNSVLLQKEAAAAAKKAEEEAAAAKKAEEEEAAAAAAKAEADRVAAAKKAEEEEAAAADAKAEADRLAAEENERKEEEEAAAAAAKAEADRVAAEEKKRKEEEEAAAAAAAKAESDRVAAEEKKRKKEEEAAAAAAAKAESDRIAAEEEMEPRKQLYLEISKYNEIGLKYIIDTIFKKLLSYYLETSDKKLIINTIFEKFSFLIKYLDYVTVYDENIPEYKSDGGEYMPQNRYKKDLKYSLLRQIVIRHSEITNSMAYVIKQTMEIDGPLSKQSDSPPIHTLHSKLIGFLNKVEVIIARLINIYDALLECKNIIMKFDSIISSKDSTKANIINKLNDNGSAEVDRLEVFRNIKLVPVRMARINLFKVEDKTRIADNFFQSYKPVHIKFIMDTIIKKTY